MQELFEDISKEVKEIADIAWRLAVSQPSAIGAAKFLDTVINYYDMILSEREMEFLRFYFNMKLEAQKE